MIRKNCPLITFLITAYNFENYIGDAIKAAFSQTYSPLEIIISDDCSTDRTFEIIKDMKRNYRGSHKIIINKNEKNLGLGGHINRVMGLVNGEIIVVANGDDISYPERTQKIYEAYNKTIEKPDSLFSNVLIIDKNLIEHSLQFKAQIQNKDLVLDKIIDSNFILSGCSHAYTRRLFDIFGPLVLPVKVCDDMVIPFRSALIGRIKYIDEVLVKHRRHDANTYAPHRMSSKTYDPIKRIKFTTDQLPEIFNNWLKDIDIYLKNNPNEKNQIKSIKNRIEERLEEAKNDILLHNSSVIRKLIIIFKQFSRGMSWGKTRKKIGIFLLPGIYRMYVKLKFKLIDKLIFLK
jgi:glycosyltransferase involved in cell wall biosynthesis